MKLDCNSESSDCYHLPDFASSLLFAVVHAVISMVAVVVVAVVFGYGNYDLVVDYTVDVGLADFVRKYFEAIETEMVDGTAGFEEIVVVVVVVVVVVGKMIVVVDIVHTTAVALAEQQQNFPLDDMAVVV